MQRENHLGLPQGGLIDNFGEQMIFSENRIRTFFIPLFCAFLAFARPAACESVKDHVLAAFNKVYGLKMMEAGREYTVRVGTAEVKGVKEIFLRRRSPEEIISSGLSSGCGDYAAAFYGLMSGFGAELLFIDSAELSVSSLINGFKGHAVVAVKDPETKKWILADPTAGQIISEDWDLSSKIYRTGSGSFYIGYMGSLEGYPYKTPAALRAFYEETLKKAPKEVLDGEVVRLDFSVSTSPPPEGSFLNKRIPEFIRDYGGIYEKLGVNPKKYVRVKLLPGSAGSETGCKKSGEGGLECGVGGNSEMSGNLFFWLERKVGEYLEGEKPLVYSSGKAGCPGEGVESPVILLPKTFSVRFTEDRNMKKDDGSWKNPFYAEFRKKYGSPRGFPVRVLSNGKNTVSHCELKGNEAVCFFGDESGLGDSVFKLVENVISKAK